MSKIILDFDGTVVEHRYPRIGKAVPHAERVLFRLQEKDIQIVLNTARCEIGDNDSFEASKKYLDDMGIKIHSCTKRKIHPTWSVPFGEDIYIDDIAEGIPLSIDTGGIDMVDWSEIEKLLEKHGIL